MKQITIGLLLFLSLSCKEVQVELDYSKMIAEDQLYVNTDKSDIKKYNADKLKRKAIFKRNFELIIDKTKQSGFPYVSLENHQLDSCKYWAVSMTMIHTAQSNPELFFSDKYSKIFKAELEKGNLERTLLEQSSIITAKTIDLCEDLKPQMKSAAKLWGVDYSVFEEANFVSCK
ncbi:MAG: hypothetical protein AAF960_00630 [Bacteroidota bacterium]